MLGEPAFAIEFSVVLYSCFVTGSLPFRNVVLTAEDAEKGRRERRAIPNFDIDKRFCSWEQRLRLPNYWSFVGCYTRGFARGASASHSCEVTS